MFPLIDSFLDCLDVNGWIVLSNNCDLASAELKEKIATTMNNEMIILPTIVIPLSGFKV